MELLCMPLTFALFKTILNNMQVKTFTTFFKLCLLLLTTVATAQTATLRGSISLSGNQSADNISITLKGTQLGAATDENGNYEIKNIKPGSYVIRVSSISFAPKEKNITLRSGEEAVENFTLSASSETLTEVVVNSNKGNPYARRDSETVSKMPLKDIENPQVYNTISAELLKEQVVTNFDDALKNAPGLDKLWESTGRGGDGAGYFSLRGFAVQPTMINGLPGLTAGSPDPANIERIEVIKGPSGTLFGSSLISYGGLINITTKKPYETFGGNVSYIGGTYGLNRVTGDINTPLGDSKKAFARVNFAYHNENSFQDAGFKKSFFIAPSFTFKASERLTFDINSEFYNARSTNQTMLFLDRGAPLRAHNIAELGYDRNRSYTSNDLYLDTPTFNVQGQMRYKFNNNWTSQTAISRSSAKSQGYYSYLYEGTTQIQSLTTTPLDGIILARYTSKQNAETYGTDIQQNFIGDFKIGQFRNKFIGGLDYFNLNTTSNSTGYGSQGFVNLGVNEATFQTLVPALHAISGTPYSTTTGDSGVLTQTGADAGISALANPSTSPAKSKQEVYSAYVSDVFYVLPSLSAMASVRVDRFVNSGDPSTEDDDYNQTSWSPKFGVVYQPIKDKLAVFANYMNGFANVAPSTNRINNNDIPVTFKPEHAEQFEFGIKVDLFKERVTAAASYYNTDVADRVYQITETVEDPANPGQNITNFINVQNGTQRNKGFEASITANPVDGLNFILGYSYNDSKLVKGDADFQGRRPESAGPQNLANAWVSYKFTTGTLQGFGLGFGGNYGSENKIMNRETAGVFTLPDYTILNAAAYYTIDKFQFTAKLDNLTNKDYYKGWSTISPQKPRVFALGATFNF